MGTQRALSRRHMLAMSAAAGSLAIGGGCRDAAAQAAKRIERLDPALDQIISTSEPIVDFATNLGGIANVEGPLWWKEGGYLLFRGTDNKRWKYAPGQALSVFKENTNAANGITRDMQGRLVACEAATRRIVREESDGSITVLASSFQGRPFNRPNDIVVKSDGAIYFTDPWTAAEAPGETDLTFAGVFRISPDRGTLTLLVDDLLAPNGIAFSPDEKVLYVNDSRRRHIRAFDLQPNGTLARQTDRVFARFGRPRARWSRRHEGRYRRQRLLRRLGRTLHHRPEWQETRPHRARLSEHVQRRLRWRRLEDRLFLHAHEPRLVQGQDRRRAGAGRKEILKIGPDRPAPVRRGRGFGKRHFSEDVGIDFESEVDHAGQDRYRSIAGTCVAWVIAAVMSYPSPVQAQSGAPKFSGVPKYEVDPFGQASGQLGGRTVGWGVHRCPGPCVRPASAGRVDRGHGDRERSVRGGPE